MIFGVAFGWGANRDAGHPGGGVAGIAVWPMAPEDATLAILGDLVEEVAVAG